MKIRNVIVLCLLISMAFIVYYFIKEQFNHVVLSQKENIFLSVLYLVVGIGALILFRMKNTDNMK